MKMVLIGFNMVLSTQWYSMKVFMSHIVTSLRYRIKVTSFETDLILATLYIFPSNFGPSKAARMVKVPLESSCHSLST